MLRAVAIPAASLTPGTTIITGGTDKRVLFDDNGVVGEDAGLSYNKTTKALTLGGGTVTASAPALDLSQTWNNGAVVFTGLKVNVTSSASSINSLLADFQLGSTSQLNVSSNGFLAQANGGAALPTTGNTLASTVLGNQVFAVNTNNATMWNLAKFGWASTGSVVVTSVADTMLTRFAAANIHQGAADAAAPVAQTDGVQGVVAGTADTSGADRIIAGSVSTGTGVGGGIIFQTSPAAGSTASTQNALSNAWKIDGNLTFAPAATLATTMTKGFLNIPGAAGPPTGVPANTTGVPLYYDTTALKLYAYSGGAWKSSAAFT